MADSIHVARWLDLAAEDAELEILMIPTSPHRRLHPKIVQRLAEFNEEAHTGLRMNWFLRVFSLPIWVLDRDALFAGRVRAWFIASALNKFKPNLVHIMETQNGGYPFAIAQAGKPAEFKTMLTLFGSDLFWFAGFPKHLSRIKALLPMIDLLSAECTRDLTHAQELGFTGETLALMPVSGGLEDSQIADPEDLNTLASRKVIAVKGYGGVWGQGHVAIQSLGSLGQKLKDFTVVIYSAEGPAIRAAKKFLEPKGVAYRVHKKFGLSHGQILGLYRQSRIYIGLSKSDGLPASMLEAMSQGAYPIQTQTACIEGWMVPGVSGTSIGVVSVSEVASAIDFALSNDQFLLQAQTENLKTIRSKYSKSELAKNDRLSYRQLIN